MDFISITEDCDQDLKCLNLCLYAAEGLMMKWEQWLQKIWKEGELICTQRQIWQRFSIANSIRFAFLLFL